MLTVSVLWVRGTERSSNLTSYDAPVCMRCKHYAQGERCAAFPDGIPEAIFQGGNPHREPFPGDHGIQYERDPRYPPEVEE